MMMRYSFGLENVAKDIEAAVEKVLDRGYRTGDIFSEGTELVGTEKMGSLITSEISKG